MCTKKKERKREREKERKRERITDALNLACTNFVSQIVNLAVGLFEK